MLRIVLIVAACVIPLAGCGGDERDAKPAGSPRASVLGFLDDLRAGRYARACARLDPTLTAEIRLLVLGQLQVPEGGLARRHEYHRQARQETKRCPGSLRLLVEQIGSARFRTVRRTAMTAKLAELGGSGVWLLGNQAWVVEPRDGRWVIVGYDAIPSAFETAY